MDIGLRGATHFSAAAHTIAGRTEPHKDGERERCVMMVRDKALQYNADIGFPPSQTAHCAALCEVFVVEN